MHHASTPLMLRFLLLTCFLLGTVPGGEAPLRVLFLGDKGFHEPVKRFDWIKERFIAHRIEPTYTEAVADLTTDKLAGYDVLMLYANIETIAPEQEKAVIAFVDSGRGFVAVHCASACFGNSPAMTALIGARFRSHGTAVFSPKILDRTNPITLGFSGYEAWDETYLHGQHNEDGRVVLAVREEGGQQEPWTWVRSQGKGRVFYTASGHDQRVWQVDGFQDLLVRGTLWASGAKGQATLSALGKRASGGSTKDAPANPKAKPKKTSKKNDDDDADPGPRPALQYEPRPTVQNYEKRSPAPQFQLPLKPRNTLQYTTVEPEFELKLFAAEPDIAKPIAFTWDHRGRLWPAETVDYPSNYTGQGGGNDRIKICEDTDGNGRADKFTIFADKLNIPTGLVLLNDGVLVAQAPHFAFYKRAGGGDRAEPVKLVFENMWSKGDTHAGPSNLRYGLDNHLYGAVGYSGFKGKVGAEEVSFNSGIYRFSRTFDTIEFLARFSNNTWGLGFNEAGEIFGSTANGAHHWHVPIPQSFTRGVPGFATPSPDHAVKLDSHYAAHPLTKHIRQVDVQGGFTAAAGHNLYTARAFPERYWNRAALVCEPTMHLLHQGFLERSGSGWKEGADGKNLLASEDEWVAPVHAEVGPDGAVWVADWYNFIIQHNPTPSLANGGFDTTTGTGGAHVNPLRDHERGRIYRVVWKNAPATPRKALDPRNRNDLVAALADDNQFWRLTAQRLLIERGKTDVVPQLIPLIQDQGVDAVGINGGAIHALWTLHGLGVMNGQNADALAAAVAALRHPAWSVRRTAVQMLPRNDAGAAALATSGILSDTDLNVRLAAILAASTMPSSNELGLALFAQFAKDEVRADRWLPIALRLAAARQAVGVLGAALAAGGGNIPTDTNRLIGMHLAERATIEEQIAILRRLALADQGWASGILEGLAQVWREKADVKRIAAKELAPLAHVQERFSPTNRDLLGQIIARWSGSPALPKPTPAKVLSADDQRRFDAGKAKYQTICIACHQENGEGLANVAPPLAGSEWVTGDQDVLIRMVLGGIRGPITAAGVTFNLEMPGWKNQLTDQETADVLTYIRNEWGNSSRPVAPSQITGIRTKDAARTTSWTVEELLRKP